MNARRTDYKQRKLSQKRIDALDALDMIWKPKEEIWERGLTAARAYREANGDLRVKARLVTEGGFPLGQWINGRRVDYKKRRLSQKRIAELDALGMVWDALKN